MLGPFQDVARSLAQCVVAGICLKGSKVLEKVYMCTGVSACIYAFFGRTRAAEHTDASLGDGFEDRSQVRRV